MMEFSPEIKRNVPPMDELESLVLELENISSELAEEHRRRIEKGIEDLDNPDEFAEKYIPTLKKVIEFRKGKTFEIIRKYIELDENEERQIFNKLKETIEKKDELFINDGSTAIVLELAVSTRVCTKIIINKHYYQQGNSLLIESNFLQELNNLNVDGTRTPKPYYVIILKGTPVLIMEKLEAPSLRQIADKKSPLPENFNLENYFSQLKKYFLRLHKEKEIIHGDIALRNFLVDKKTGLPLVVDFGRSLSMKELKMEASQNPMAVDPVKKFKQLKKNEIAALNTVFREAKSIFA